MVVDRCESSEQVTTCWHQCPLCKQVRLTSERDSSLPEHAGDVAFHADDDIGYSTELETQAGAGYAFS